MERRSELADPDLGSLQVLQDRDRPSGVFLEVADRIEAILAGATCSDQDADGLMSEMDPDTVMGALR